MSWTTRIDHERAPIDGSVVAQQHRIFRDTSDGVRDNVNNFSKWQDRLWTEYTLARGLDNHPQTRDAHQEAFTAWVKEKAYWQGRVADPRQREIGL